MIVVVTGGRDFGDFERVYRSLDYVHGWNPISLLVNGAATGADNLSAWWAYYRGIPRIDCPADWKKHGKAAGPIRNSLMLEEYRPQLVVAFPGGRGTQNMRAQAIERGIPIFEG